MILTSQQILDARKNLRREVLPLPALGGDVWVSELMGKERELLENAVTEVDGKRVVENLRGKVAALSLSNEDGSKMFTWADAAVLGELPANALDAIFEKAQELSVLGPKKLKDLEGN